MIHDVYVNVKFVVCHAGGTSRGDYVQEKVRPGTGREAGLDHVRRDCVSLLTRLYRIEARAPLLQVLDLTHERTGKIG